MRSVWYLCVHVVGGACSRQRELYALEPEARMSSSTLRSWHTERAGERSREGKSEMDGVWGTQDERSGIDSCCKMKLLEGFL